MYHSENTYEIRLEICTGFAAVSNETATTTLWPLVIATVAVRTAMGHFLNGHNAVGAIVCTVFYAVSLTKLVVQPLKAPFQLSINRFPCFQLPYN